MSLISEFKDFIKEYKVIGLAVAFVMGLAVNDLVKSLVDNIIMPLVSPLMASGTWQTATLVVGPVILGIGPFIAALINFLIMALVVFLIVKKVMKDTK